MTLAGVGGMLAGALYAIDLHPLVGVGLAYMLVVGVKAADIILNLRRVDRQNGRVVVVPDHPASARPAPSAASSAPARPARRRRARPRPARAAVPRQPRAAFWRIAILGLLFGALFSVLHQLRLTTAIVAVLACLAAAAFLLLPCWDCPDDDRSPARLAPTGNRFAL